MTPEGKVKLRVKKLLDEFDVWHFSPVASAMGRAGIPDIIACVRGYFVAIECKAGGNPPTKIQQYEMGLICRAGGVALVINEEGLLGLHHWLSQITGQSDQPSRMQ